MATTETALIRVIDGAFVIGQEYQLALTSLKSKVAALVPVQDQHSYEETMEVVRQGRDEIKMLMAIAEPEIVAARRRLEELRSQRDAFVAQFASAFAMNESQARTWNLNERNAALAEQKDMNYGKPAEKRVTVQPNIPAVAGTRVIPHYRADILDASKVKRAYLMPDIKAIEKKAREDKDPAKTEKEVGGIRVRME